jgi:hypothetical protein
MKLIKSGATRNVLLIGKYALKFPVFSSHKFFLVGCLHNWQERVFYKASDMYCINTKHLMCPSIFCSWFGILQIQLRATQLDRELTNKEINLFSAVCSDIKKENFGLLNNKLICIDYAV